MGGIGGARLGSAIGGSDATGRLGRGGRSRGASRQNPDPTPPPVPKTPQNLAKPGKIAKKIPSQGRGGLIRVHLLIHSFQGEGLRSGGFWKLSAQLRLKLPIARDPCPGFRQEAGRRRSRGTIGVATGDRGRDRGAAVVRWRAAANHRRSRQIVCRGRFRVDSPARRYPPTFLICLSQARLRPAGDR